jgi:hypothetical protein
MDLNTASFAVFGQELYHEESLQAIKSLQNVEDDRRLALRIADLLPHSSQGTRLRVASKIAQRFFKPSGELPSTAFLKFVNGIENDQARRDLLYWRAARTDSIIAAIASEVFYPYFILNSIPSGYDESAFHMANTATLFEIDRVITTDFASDYAKKAWGFNSSRTVTLALRIMKQAQILDCVSVKLGRRHVLGYYPQQHSLRPEVFAYCMCEEFLEAKSDFSLSLDRLHNGECVKLFFLNRLQVDSLLRSLERKRLIKPVALPGGRHIRFSSGKPDSFVDDLLEKARF